MSTRIHNEENAGFRKIVTIFPVEWWFYPDGDIRLYRSGVGASYTRDEVKQRIQELRTAAQWLENALKEFEGRSKDGEDKSHD